MAPVWKALPSRLRGSFLTNSDRVAEYLFSQGITPVIQQPDTNLTVVSSYGDYKLTNGPTIYMEHGIGHQYSNAHPSYTGSKGKDRVVLFLTPHEIAAAKVRRNYRTPVEVIGTPKLDTVEVRPARGRTVAVSWHWDCKVAPETRTALPAFKPILKMLRDAKDLELIGHAHPRSVSNPSMQKMYRELRIEYVHDFTEVLERADVYVIDNSSTAYEFAAAGRHVLHLDAPWYRKEINHGIRFWDYIPGPQSDHPRDVLPKIRDLLDNPDKWEQQRLEVVKKLYPYLGRASARAAKKIGGVAGRFPYTPFK